MEGTNQAFRNRNYLEICSREQEKRSYYVLNVDSEFGVWIWNKREHRLFLSESLTKMIGIPDGMIPSLELLLEFVLGEDQEVFLEFLEGMVDGRIWRELEFRVLRGKRVRCVVERVGSYCVGVCFFIRGNFY